MLANSSVAQKFVDFVCHGVDDFCNKIVEHLRSEVTKITCREGLSPHAEAELQSLLKCVESPLNFLSSTHRREVFFQKTGLCVLPQKIVLGSRSSTKRTRDGFAPQPAQFSMQLIPLRRSLENLFTSEQISSHVKLPSDALLANPNPTVFTRALDGHHMRSLYRRVKEDYVAIELYYDDIEVVNPIGTKKGPNKLGVFYYCIRNLPNHMNCHSANIHLLCIGYTMDFKECGYEKIMGILQKEFSELENNGFSYNGRKLKVVLLNVIGDNLGLNTILGLKQRFWGVHFCRFCHASTETIQTTFVEDQFHLRSKAEFDNLTDQEREHYLREHGLSGSSVLNSLQYFHTFENYSVDLMHDILEGHGQHIANLVIRHLIRSTALSVDILNRQIAWFPYGRTDRKNRPTEIPADRLRGNPCNTVSQRAAQSWCLLRLLPLLLRRYVSVDDPVWAFYVEFLLLLELLFAPVIAADSLPVLKADIRRHLSQFKQLFPDQQLTPKSHFLVHYPRIIEEMGPPYFFWCMHMEMKHNFLKRYAHINQNYRNLPLTLAKKHQMYAANVVLSGSFIKAELDRGGIEWKVVSAEAWCDSLLLAFPQLSADSLLEATESLTFLGVEYRFGDVLILDFNLDRNVPVLGRITDIVEIEGVWYIVVGILTIRGRDADLNAYAVEPGNMFRFVTPGSLVSFHPLDLYEFDEGMLIPLRHAAQPEQTDQ
uniref:Uncharacterized protein n=1 Tax=Plectus sambesii TaxID=2011161 RepID=A0A914XA41_9BILA